ncbi:MAG: hypothetical protein CMJ85_06710 [Planctomycetes bacterium]|nr:hypothetical protein [Planctomycetota bacterium]MDP6423573.1 Arc family DNA-binding protein [Planctomycetota bacterium]
MAVKRKPFLLRISPKLFHELRGWAEQEMRSVNGQIEFLLREAVRKRCGREVLPGDEERDREVNDDGR